MKEFIVFIFVSIVLIFGSISVYQTGDETFNWQTTESGDPINQSYSVDTNWDNTSVSANNDCLVSNDGDLLYPDQNAECSWFSLIQQDSTSDILFLTTEANAQEGTVNMTVRAWEYPPEDQGAPNETQSFLVDTGTETNRVGFVNYTYFDVVANMEETGGNQNQRPHLDSFDLIFKENTDQVIGVGSDTIRTLSILIFLIGLVLFFSKATGS